jgi:hypothetical protein
VYRIKLKRTSHNQYDEVIEIEHEENAHWRYWQYMKGEYYFGSLVKLVNGREENMASFCNSEFARG